MTAPHFTIEELQNEEWKVVTDFPDYEVSTLGRIRRATVSKRLVPIGYMLKPFEINSRYQAVKLSRDGKKCAQLVHRLVALTFLAEPGPDQTDVNHKDGNRNNNRLSNLEWASRTENVRHARDTLHTLANGERHHKAKMTRDIVLKIHQMRMSGIKPKTIALTLNIPLRRVSQVLTGRSWKEVTQGLPKAYPKIKKTN